MVIFYFTTMNIKEGVEKRGHPSCACAKGTIHQPVVQSKLCINSETTYVAYGYYRFVDPLYYWCFQCKGLAVKPRATARA